MTALETETWNAALDAALERLSKLHWTDQGGGGKLGQRDLNFNPKPPSWKRVMETVDRARKPSHRLRQTA